VAIAAGTAVEFAWPGPSASTSSCRRGQASFDKGDEDERDEDDVLAGLALAVVGGRGPGRQVDFDKAANFGAIKTFSIKLGASWGNPISEKRVMDEFTQALAGKAGRWLPRARPTRRW